MQFLGLTLQTLLGFHSADMSIPTGVVLPFAGTEDSVPSGFLICAGQLLDRTVYTTLFAVIGEIFGTGPDPDQFALPDLRGNVPAGKDDMGGTPAGRIVGIGPGGILDGVSLGAQGGQDRNTDLPLHLHTYNDPNTADSTGGQAGSDYNAAVASTATNGSTSQAGVEAVTNIQPTIILNYIIKI